MDIVLAVVGGILMTIGLLMIAFNEVIVDYWSRKDKDNES